MRSPRRPRIMRATGGSFHLTWRIAVTKPEDPGTNRRVYESKTTLSIVVGT